MLNKAVNEQKCFVFKFKITSNPQKRDLFGGGFFSLKTGSGILGRSQTVFIYKEYIHPKYSNRQA